QSRIVQGTKLPGSYWRRHVGSCSLRHRTRGTFFEDCSEQHSKWTTNKANNCGKRSQDLGKSGIEITCKQPQDWNNDRAQKKQHSALSQALLSWRDFLRSCRVSINRQHASVIQQLQHSIERETTSRTKPDSSR